MKFTSFFKEANVGIHPSCWSWGWRLGLASFVVIGGVIASSVDCAFGQIAPDGTLPNNSIVTPQGNTALIEAGTQAGSNLFHSFKQFSVPTGGAAYFNNALDIQNIISRVTGASVSNIDGLIRANGAANLFLLNPNGIIFGSNASLSIGGSFLASTASSLKFADGNQFSATAPQTTPLLTVNVPLGLQFGGNAGRILVQGNGQGIRSTTELIDTTVGLRVQPNQTLALVGGDVALEGGTLKTAGGRIELGSVADPGLVSLTPTNKGWVLGYEGILTFGDIHLSNTAAVDASGAGGGDIQVRGRRVTLQDGSGIEASTLRSEPGGTLNVTAAELVELIGTTADGQAVSALGTSVGPGATGTGGNLTVETGRLIVRDGAQIGAGTFGAGAAGVLAVRASESVELIRRSADGRAGSGLFTSVQYGAKGNGGNLTVETGRLIVRDGAQVSAGTFDEGAGGTLTVRASESVELIGTSADKQSASGLYAQADEGATGAAGSLTVETGRLIVQNGAQVSVATFGVGAAGNLAVKASESVELSGTSAFGSRRGSGLFTSVNPRATGNGGNLTVETGRLIVRDGAFVAAATFGAGAAGTLTVRASESVELSGTSTDGQVSSRLTVQTNGTGNAGDLRIETGQLTVLDRAQVNVSSQGSGIAGNLQVQARSIKLDNQGAITATNRSGNGGNITLQAQDLLLLRRNSNISSTAGTAQAGGDGGNINIDSDLLVLLENSDITANAFTGSGGNIQINTQGIFRSPESDITASSEFGIEGVVEINTPDVDPSGGLVELPVQPTETEVVQACKPGGSQANSEFVITGRGGLPPSPTETLSSDAISVDWVSLNPESENRSSAVVSTNSTSPHPETIVEAQGWVVDDNGEVVLTASAPTVTPDSSWQTPAKCHGSS